MTDALERFAVSEEGGGMMVEAADGEWVRADHALALVAEAYEDMASTVEHIGFVENIGFTANFLRARTPSDALAAREARDKRVRGEALREGRGVTPLPRRDGG